MTTRQAGTAPDIDFRRLRAYGSPGSLADAFEEIVSIVLKTTLVQWPTGTRFNRFGNPDGGREGNAVLPNGDVWAWQAKFLFGFDKSEIDQVDKSVKRALGTEPNLKRYYVALPYDLPAGDTGGDRPKKSAHTKWTEKVAEWEGLATALGRTVTFHYIGAHHLTTALTQPEHAGRLRYWFDSRMLAPADLRLRLEDVIAKAGRRYSPRVHVEVDAIQALDGLGRAAGYIERVQRTLAGIRAARVSYWTPPKDGAARFEEPTKRSLRALIRIEQSLEQLKDGLEQQEPITETVAALVPLLRSATERLRVINQILRERHLTDGRYYVDQAGSLHRTASEALDAVENVKALLDSDATTAADTGLLLMTGRAGTGKTHLFCDVATHRIEQGRPTLVALGQDFDSGPLALQISTLVNLHGSLDEVLAVLDAAGEAAGTPALLMIDALNESIRPERWVDDLRVLRAAVGRHPHVALAVSCRTEFVAHTVGVAEGFALVAHQGFSEATPEAIDRYTTEYGLERLTFPPLNPEYGNPLFLKLACEALSTLGPGSFSLGTAGLSTVTDAFLRAVNQRLAGPTRCDYDENDNLVAQAVRELAATGPGPYDHQTVKNVTEKALPAAGWSKSLFLGLKREGVLIDAAADQYVFGYQRLADVVRASLLSEKTVNELRAWFAGLGTNRWNEQGTLGALAVVAPATPGGEIVDLFRDEDGSVPYVIVDAFLESLVLRSPHHTTDRTSEIVHEFLNKPNWRDKTIEQLVRVACTPGHSVNFDWTHELLLRQSLTLRDVVWSEWAVNRTDDPDTGLNVFLGWAWVDPTATETPGLPVPLSDDVARLAALALGWLLSVPDRRIRDRATKALVSIGERATPGFAAAIRQFRTCNDPFVIERLAAACCGVALRRSDPAAVLEVADAAAELVADEWPTHLMSRDYLRRVSNAARRLGWGGPTWAPPYGTRWPPPAMQRGEIEQLDSDHKQGYWSIWGSLQGFGGDFGRYEIEPALRDFNTSDHEQLQELVERVIFTRVLDLGWTPEQFVDLDRGRHGGHDGPVERYGKKYQWIALHETLGRLADNRQLEEKWGNPPGPYDYQYAEQVVDRDIDPTVLVMSDRDRPAASQHARLGHQQSPRWFAPIEATFPADVQASYPRDLDGVPDPLDLIVITDLDQTKWYSLIRYANWTQTLPPEIEALKAPTLNVWMQTRSYLVAHRDVPALRAFLDGADWDGRWMAEHAELHSRLLGAHPDVPDWNEVDGVAEPRHGGPRVPVELLIPTGAYEGTGTSKDHAGTREPTGFVPSRPLWNMLKLGRGVDFRWSDSTGLAVTDPTAALSSGSTLLMRADRSTVLADAGYTMFWTVLLNKQRQNVSRSLPDDDQRWISASASYLLTGSAAELVSATATLRTPAVTGIEHEPVGWVPARRR